MSLRFADGAIEQYQNRPQSSHSRRPDPGAPGADVNFEDMLYPDFHRNYEVRAHMPCAFLTPAPPNDHPLPCPCAVADLQVMSATAMRNWSDTKRSNTNYWLCTKNGEYELPRERIAELHLPVRDRHKSEKEGAKNLALGDPY